MEKIEEIGFGGLKLIQDPDGFKFGIDAILLADFANALCPQAEAIADLGTGNGIIPVVLSHKNQSCRVTGIDVQAKAIKLSNRNRQLNHLEDRLAFLQMDIRDVLEQRPGFERHFDAVVTNPPYVPSGSGIANADDAKFIARQETTADLECFIRTAARMLRDRGHFFIVQRPSRLADLIYYCRKYGLEPKHLQMVTPRSGERPNILLLHCILGAGRELTVLEELAVRDENNSYTLEIERIYERENSRFDEKTS
ncbi:MAG: tRNA1(Val) (adenine(37)-N6)-methyltransferase [Firmicutes bacterium]|nr:tRNA1(Val) (adenine(37)-N6)-methyltransferase [Bacillota bacterium]